MKKDKKMCGSIPPIPDNVSFDAETVKAMRRYVAQMERRRKQLISLIQATSSIEEAKTGLNLIIDFLVYAEVNEDVFNKSDYVLSDACKKIDQAIKTLDKLTDEVERKLRVKKVRKRKKG